MTAPTLAPVTTVTCPVCHEPWERDALLWPDSVCPDHEPTSTGTWDAGRLERWLLLNGVAA